jgi:hypothetical protein
MAKRKLVWDVVGETFFLLLFAPYLQNQAAMSTDDQIIEKLKQASQLMKSYNWAGADELFQTILAEGPMNPNVEKFSAAVLGMRAECLFAQGKVRSVPLFSSLFFFLFRRFKTICIFDLLQPLLSHALTDSQLRGTARQLSLQ